MLLDHPDLMQRAVWILQTLYLDRPGAALAPDPALAALVCDRLGAPPHDAWPEPHRQASLSALLAEHARQVCRPEAPDCGRCELRKFCNRYRTEQQAGWMGDTHSPTVVDLFCGAGGAALGFVQAGFRLLLAVDVDERALLTLRLNHPGLPAERVLQADLFELADEEKRRAFRTQLLELLGGAKVDVVVGGPPCQGFSLIGTTGRASLRSARGVTEGIEAIFKADPRNRLYNYYMLMVEWLNPDFCVMENVPTMISIADSRIRDLVEGDLRRLGFASSRARIYNCEDHGVPQVRRRAIFLAARGLLGDVQPVSEPVLLGDAIRDLPPVSAGSGQEVTRRTADPTSSYARDLASGTKLVHNHVARPHQESDLKLYALLKPGQRVKDSEEAQALNNYRHYAFSDIYKRQSYERPSSTVLAHLAKDGNMFIHPEQTRTYTVREAARVQSFPDDFIFCGPRTSQFRQVGNAVPPMFARQIAHLIQALRDGVPPPGQQQTQTRFV